MRRPAALLTAAACVGCADEPLPPDDYVDLDAVLTVWDGALADLDAATAPATARAAATMPHPPRDRLLRTALNARLAAEPARLQLPATVAVAIEPDGAVQGFIDHDGDQQPTVGEPLVFRLVADLDRRRLLAVDLVHPRWMRARDLPDGEVGLATAYALGRMRYAQTHKGVKTDSFGKWRVAEPGYHANIEAARRYGDPPTPSP